MDERTPIEIINEWNNCTETTVREHVENVISVCEDSLSRLDSSKVPGLYKMYTGRRKLYKKMLAMLSNGVGSVKSCLYCNEDFPYKSEKKQFCSAKCRVAYNRKIKN